MSTLKEKLEEYSKEYTEDVKLDRINLSEVSLKIPGIKAKWVTRLIYHRCDLNELYELRSDLIENLSKKNKQDALIAINDVQAYKQAEKNELVMKCDKEINTQKLIIDFLEKIEKSISTINYDIRNQIDLIKMETL